jgi:exodeoxyribonuclease VII small subunit
MTLPFPGDVEDATAPSFEMLLARLESTILLLAEGTAPLDELVAAHQRAAGLLSEAEQRLASLKARADQLVVALKA